jgi:NADPH-dependent curcumin reductase CurA
MQTVQVLLASRPTGEPTDENFEFATQDLPDPVDGELLLRVIYLSLDPYMRGRMSAAKSYAAPVEVGDVLEGGTVCEVMESRHPDYQPGDIVLSYSGWQTHALSDGRGLRRLEPFGAPVSTALGVLGMPGFTAYAGLRRIGRPQPGETLVVAAATGPVGSAVGQIAKIEGARAVGVAGGPEKCAAVLDEFGFDAAIDHRATDFAERLRESCPDGVDVYFENVGGHVTEAVLPLLNEFARVPVCGLVANYNATQAPEGPDRLPGYLQQVLVKSLTVRGFIQREFVKDLYPDFLRDMSRWVLDGSVRYREDVVVGLGSAPEAFHGLLNGRNFGKMVVEVGPLPA